MVKLTHANKLRGSELKDKQACSNYLKKLSFDNENLNKWYELLQMNNPHSIIQVVGIDEMY